jgi:hypothetical protein
VLRYKTEIISRAGKWMKPEIIMLSEASQVQKDKGHMFSLLCGRQIQKTNIYTNKNTIIYIYEHVCSSNGIREEKKNE